MIDNYIGKWDKKRLMFQSEFVTERQIGEIKVLLPNPPEDITQILNYEEKVLANQKWKPPRIPTDKELKDLPSNERIEFIRRELDRRTNGVFFFNHGGIEYLTGKHYFYLTYWRAEGVGLPDFRDADRDFFYAWEEVEKDTQCFGLAYYTNRRQGKALDINTPIPTPNGWTTMEHLKKGDVVFDSLGQKTNVTFATEIQYNRNCYKVNFSDNSSIVADEEHLWIVYDKVARSNIKHPKWKAHKRVKTTKELLEKMTIGKPNKLENNWSIENCLPVQYDKKDLKIPPYILGVWLRDGSSNTTAITNIDEEIIDAWKDYAKSIGMNVKKYNTDITYVISGGGSYHSNQLRNHLKYYNLFNNKHIPKDYLQSSVEDREELLKGLMDTDGNCYPKSRSVEYCSKSLELITDIYELISSLGYKSQITTKYNKKVCRDYYYIRFGIYNSKSPFKLNRKNNLLFESKNLGWRTNHRYITSITPIETRPVKCISVDSADNSYLCGKNFVVTHNTMTSTSILYEFASRNKEVHCGIQSQTNKDAKNVFRKVVFSWKKMPYFWKPTDSGDKNPKEALRFEEPSTRSSKGEVKTYKEVLDSFIDFASSTETAYDGYKLSRYYCDEFGKFTEGNAYSRWNIVKPCLQVGARIIGKAIFTTTVEELEKGGGQAAYDIYKDSDPNNKGADNRTASGLYRLFKPAYYGYEGYLDEYGYSDIEGAKKYLVAERQNKQGADLAELTRKFPFNIKEAFQSSISTNVFPIFKIIQQKEWNIENGKEPRKGNFIWENEELRAVKFVDDPNGKFQVSWLPKEEDRSKFEIIRDLPSPLFKNQGAFGVDPYDHRTTVDKERYSKGACAGFRRYDAINPENSNAFFLSYLNRPPKETILYEDLTKAFIFYGMQGLIENQKTGMHNWMNDNGFKHYIMKTQQGDYSKNTSRKFIDGVSTSGVMIREQMINGLESYIYDFIGNISPDVQRNFYGLDERSIRADLYGTCPFEDMLSDWEKFDSNDWTDYDMAVATMLAKLAVIPVRKKRLEESEDKQITLNSFFKLHKI